MNQSLADPYRTTPATSFISYYSSLSLQIQPIRNYCLCTLCPLRGTFPHSHTFSDRQRDRGTVEIMCLSGFYWFEMRYLFNQFTPFITAPTGGWVVGRSMVLCANSLESEKGSSAHCAPEFGILNRGGAAPRSPTHSAGNPLGNPCKYTRQSPVHCGY